MAADLPELLVIRHGETEWNRQNRMQGKRDSALTPLGRTQALAIGGLLERLGISATSHRIFTSPQPRARITSELALAGLGLAATPDPALCEIDVGDWTGLNRAEIDQGWPAADPDEHFLDFYARAPGGERFEALWDRVGGVLARLNGPTVIFTHGITSRFLRARALGLGLDRLAEPPDDQGGQGVIHRVRNGQHETLIPER